MMGCEQVVTKKNEKFRVNVGLSEQTIYIMNGAARSKGLYQAQIPRRLEVDVLSFKHGYRFVR